MLPIFAATTSLIACKIVTPSEKIAEIEQNLKDLEKNFAKSNQNRQNFENFFNNINKQLENLTNILSDQSAIAFKSKTKDLLTKLKNFSNQDLADFTKNTEFKTVFGNLLKIVEKEKNTVEKQDQEKQEAPKNPAPEPAPPRKIVPDPPEVTASFAPQGQTFSKWDSKNNKRIVEDQYQFDDPKRELNYYKSLNTISTQTNSAYRPRFFKLYPESFDPVEKSILEQLNQKAKEANQPYYQNAQFRAFSLPKYDQTGKIVGLEINEFEQPLGVPAYWGPEKQTGGPNRNGLPRVLPNNNYKELTKNSFSFIIHNGRVRGDDYPYENMDDKKPVIQSSPAYGTVSILDYEKKDDNSYPLKWFFITNAHVAGALRLAGDSPSDSNQVWGRDELNYSEKYRQYNTWSIALTKLKKSTPVFAKIPTSLGENYNNYYDQISIRVKELNGELFNDGKGKEARSNVELVNKTPKQPLNVRTIVMGTNALKSSPKDFSDQERYKNVEEVLDFAVIEVNFDNEAQARKITEDYYNETKNQSNSKIKFSIRPENFLEKEEYEKIHPTDFYGFGWPSTKNEHEKTLDRYENSREFNARKFSVSPWFNKSESLFFNKDSSDARWKNGGEFSWTRSYRSFVNLPGITDYLISNPTLGENYFGIDHAALDGKYDKSPYLLSGQGFLIDNFSSGGGVSGTAIRDSNQKVYGLLFASDKTASAAMVLALRSYGYDYKGYYGKYNLPAYDLIYGSKNQFKSYFDAMLQLYGNKNLKTNLFPNGFSESTRIDTFKDKKTVDLPAEIQSRTYQKSISKAPKNY